MDKRDVIILVNPEITPDQLWNFYIKNDICEVGYGKEIAVKPLKHSSLIVGAFHGDKLIGISRAMFDGVGAGIVEFCLDIEFQGSGLKYDNGSIIEKDEYGIGKEIGQIMINELKKMGTYFFTTYILENCQETFYKSLNFRENKEHLVYIIDDRPYVNEGER